MKQWYALRSKPKREASAATLLARVAIEVYMPQVAVQRERGKPSVLVPFFPGYFFGRLDPQQGEIQMARYTPGVVDVVGYGGQPWPVPDDLVLAIKERLARHHGARALADFRPGDRVVITGGPLRDTEAIFDRHLSAAGRVRVLIRLLHRLCRADVYVGQLRPATKAAGAPRP